MRTKFSRRKSYLGIRIVDLEKRVQEIAVEVARLRGAMLGDITQLLLPDDDGDGGDAEADARPSVEVPPPRKNTPTQHHRLRTQAFVTMQVFKKRTGVYSSSSSS